MGVNSSKSNFEDRIERLEIMLNESFVDNKIQVELLTKEINNKNREIERIRNEYERLFEKYKIIKTQKEDDHEENDHKESEVNINAIDKFVEDILQDPNTNIYGIPDFIEREMYKRVGKTILVSLEKIIENVSFDVMGHTIQYRRRYSKNSEDI